MYNNIKFWQVDAFCDRAFKGNPAAVFIVEEFADDKFLQNLAMEMNLSETVFAKRIAQDKYHIRWFTPQIEVKLCGHATLATAHILFNNNSIAGNKIIFESLSGELIVTRNNDLILLDFPIKHENPSTISSKLELALSIMPEYVGEGEDHIVIKLESENEVKGVMPDFNKLAEATTKGVIITAVAEDPSYDYVLRYFAPCKGINEDPVTGSANTILASFWQKQTGKKSFTAKQVSNRGGVLHIEAKGERVIIGGNAITIFEGNLVFGNKF